MEHRDGDRPAVGIAAGSIRSLDSSLRTSSGDKLEMTMKSERRPVAKIMLYIVRGQVLRAALAMIGRLEHRDGDRSAKEGEMIETLCWVAVAVRCKWRSLRGRSGH